MIDDICGIDMMDVDDDENPVARVLFMNVDRENVRCRAGADDDDDDDARGGGVLRLLYLLLTSPIVKLISICRLVLFNSSS